MRQRLIDNPIIALETRALTRAERFSLAWPQKGWRSRFLWLYRWTMMLGVAAYYALHLIGSLIPFDLIAFQELPFMRGGRVLLVIIGLTEMFLLVARTLTVGSSLIVREIMAGRWDLLLLTGVTARQLTWGKALAGLLSLRGAVVYVAVIRVGMSLSLGYSILSIYSPPFSRTMDRDNPSLSALILLPLLALLLTEGVAACGVSFGLLMSALSKYPGRAMLGSAGGFLGLWMLLALCGSTFNRIIIWAGADIVAISKMFLSNFLYPLDGGTFLLTILSVYPDTSLRTLQFGLAQAAVFHTLAILCCYAVLVIIILSLTEFVLKKQGVSKG